MLAKFVLLRYDQMSELAYLLRLQNPASNTFDKEALALALREIKDPHLSHLKTYFDYMKSPQSERRDFQRLPVFIGRGSLDDKSLPDGVEKRKTENDDPQYWIICGSGRLPSRLGDYDVERTATPGEVRLVKHPRPNRPRRPPPAARKK